MHTSLYPDREGCDPLPRSFAIFPLHGVVLLPGAVLPLNIFEPRYLNMIEDTMRESRLIGMIQPPEEDAASALSEVGCAGRVSQYIETSDGRIEILLTGVCRFRVREELPSTRGYRVVQPDWAGFAGDLEPQQPREATMQGFRAALRQYFATQGIRPNWEVLDGLEANELISSLVMVLPLESADKQLLIEAPDLERRVQLFGSLIGFSPSTEGVRH